MREIFVFGSNLEGRHGKGTALEAKKNWGAIYGQGVGLQGNSYAIPTKSTPYETLPLNTISKYVMEFLDFAEANPDMLFLVTPIGCGLAGYVPEQVAPMFRDTPHNVVLPEVFHAELCNE